MQETCFNPWVRKIPWRRKWLPTPVFLPENPMDRGAWQAIVHKIAKSQTQLSDLNLFTSVTLKELNPVSSLKFLSQPNTKLRNFSLYTSSLAKFIQLLVQEDIHIKNITFPPDCFLALSYNSSICEVKDIKSGMTNFLLKACVNKTMLL